MLRRLAIRPKTQFTPLPSAPRAQQVREGRGGSWLRPGLEEEGDGWVQGKTWHLTSVPGPVVEWPLPSALPRRACPALGKYLKPSRAEIPRSVPLARGPAVLKQVGSLEKLPDSPTPPASLLPLLIQV